MTAQTPDKSQRMECPGIDRCLRAACMQIERCSFASAIAWSEPRQMFTGQWYRVGTSTGAAVEPGVFQCPQCGTGMEIDPSAKPSTPSSERFTVIEECAKACEERFADPAWSADIRGAAATCASVIRRLLASPPTTAESGMALMAQNGMTIGDVLRIERAKYERAVDHLTRIYSLLNPPEVEAKGQRFRFNNPSANDTLQALSDAIRAIPEEMRSTPSTLAGSGPSQDCIDAQEACIDLFDDYEWSELQNDPPSIRNAWKVGEALSRRSAKTGSTNG